MKKIMYLILIFCLLVANTTGCSKKSEPEFARVELQNVPKEVQNFIYNNSGENGVYLYSDNNIGEYFFLNVIQEEYAVFSKDFNYNIKDNTFNICFNEEKLPLAISRKLNGKIIYKIKLSDKFDTIRVFKNGKQISFDVVGT
ncbi:MAG: hypothetical protein P4L59_20520 [Desulfosporosinus sp.]|nr:hypothetical protein [Desulfosporosinus sp.]